MGEPKKGTSSPRSTLVAAGRPQAEIGLFQGEISEQNSSRFPLEFSYFPKTFSKSFWGKLSENFQVLADFEPKRSVKHVSINFELETLRKFSENP